MESFETWESILFGLGVAGISAICWLPFSWLVYRVVTPSEWKRSPARLASWWIFIFVWLGSVYATAAVAVSRPGDIETLDDGAGLAPLALCGYGPIFGLMVSIPVGVWLRRRPGWGRPVPRQRAPVPYQPQPPAVPPQVVHQHFTVVNQIIVQPPAEPEPEPKPSKPSRRQRKVRGEIDSRPEPRYHLDETEVRYWTDDEQ